MRVSAALSMTEQTTSITFFPIHNISYTRWAASLSFKNQQYSFCLYQPLNADQLEHTTVSPYVQITYGLGKPLQTGSLCTPFAQIWGKSLFPGDITRPIQIWFPIISIMSPFRVSFTSTTTKHSMRETLAVRHNQTTTKSYLFPYFTLLR